MLQRIAAAVHARRLAVPHAGDAVELLLAHRVQHLRAPHRGGGEVFVDAVHKMNVVLQQKALLAYKRRIKHAYR